MVAGAECMMKSVWKTGICSCGKVSGGTATKCSYDEVCPVELYPGQTKLLDGAVTTAAMMKSVQHDSVVMPKSQLVQKLCAGIITTITDGSYKVI